MNPTELRVEIEIRDLMLIDKRLEDELRIVAELSVARAELADYYYDKEHMQVPTWWEDKKLYHMFMMLLIFEKEGTEAGFWDRIKKKGRELQEQKAPDYGKMVKK